MQKLILAILIFAAAYAAGMTARAYATQQQSSNRCYERCTTDATGTTHCVSWCQ